MADKTVTGTDFDGKPHKISVKDLFWRPSAYGLIIKDGKILLLKQINGYDLPGGGLDLGETPEAAVVREVKEETGMIAANPKLVGVGNSFYIPFVGKQNRHCLMIYYACDLVGGKLSTAGFDDAEKQYAIGPEWVSLGKIDNIKVGSSNDFRPYIKQILK